MEELLYLSDSTGRWRHRSFSEYEQSKSELSIQLLIHPIWWIGPETSSPIEKLGLWKEEYLTKFNAMTELNLGSFWNYENINLFKSE